MSFDDDERDDGASFDAHELAALFLPIVREDRHVALAVSGGSDSVALLVLFSDWLAQTGAPRDGVVAVTVDHALRENSAAEARQVAALADQLGLRHATLVWDGPKPATGLAAAARAARYRLLSQYMQAQGIALLLAAHTRDDQAETLLMRLARGSGVDGLAAMPPIGPLSAAPDGFRIGRPLLGVSKARLANVLRARGIAWSEDPTNQDPAYERPRLRAAGAALQSLGLTREALAQSARRLRRARSALEEIALAVFDPAKEQARVDPLGFIDVARSAFAALPEEIGLRVLRGAIQAAGGSSEPISMRALEGLLQAIRGHAGEGAWTLARAAIRLQGGVLRVAREPGRLALPSLPLQPGCRLLWDGRFWVTAGPQVPPGITLAPLEAEGLACLEAAGAARPAGVPAQVLRALPAVWRQHALLAVPSLNFSTEPVLQLAIEVRFRGIGELRPHLDCGPMDA